MIIVPNNNDEVGTLAVDKWAVWYSEEGTERGGSPPRPLLAVPNVTAHQTMASVPIIVYCCIMVCFSAVLMCPLKG